MAIKRKVFPKGKFTSAQDWHKYYVYNDSDFASDIKALKAFEAQTNPTHNVSEIKMAIAKKYKIKASDVQMYILGEILYFDHTTSSAGLDMDFEKREFAIHFGPKTTRVEMLEQWHKFEQIRAALFPIKQSKRKPTYQPGLVYAIFKCRQRDLTFREIYKLYSTGTLPGYKGSDNQYKDEDSLEKYYQANKPSP